MSIIYETSFVKLHLHPAGPVLETEWLGFVNSEQLRGTLTEALRLGRLHRINGWIANNTLLRTIRPADQDWINQEWFPEFARLGVRRMAVVVSQDGLNQMGVNAIMQRATPHLPFDSQYFADADQARRWAAGAGPATSAAAS